MSVRVGQWTLDVHDVEAMAQFWAAALGYRIDDDGQHLWPPPGAGPHALSVWLQPVDEPTPGKNRGHPDLVPDDGDADAEVERLLALGARHSDVGQSGTEGFVVLADPEGNEFCVLRRQPPTTDESRSWTSRHPGGSGSAGRDASAIGLPTG